MGYDYDDEIERGGADRRSRGNKDGRPDSGGMRAARQDDGQGTRAAARNMARQKRIEKNKRRRRIITVIIAELFALLFIFGYAYAYRIYSKPQRLDFEEDKIRNNELTVEDIKKMKGYWMIAIFGVDSRGSNVGKGTNADVSMIACINQDTGDIKLVSVFRDTYLNIDDKNTYSKINAAYAAGGPEQAVGALNKNLDLNITHYITFNWKGVAEAINILGGVDVEITRQEFKYINSFITETVKTTGIGSHQLKKAGMHHLDGVQAVAYGRLRLMDNDFARTERQRKIIELAFEKAKAANYSVLNNILVVVLPQVATNLSFGDMTNMALNITSYKLGETGGFPFARGDVTMGKKGRCVIPQTLESNVMELHKFLFGDDGYSTTDTVKKISAKIAADTGLFSQGKSQKGSAIPKDKKEPETSPAIKESATVDEGFLDPDGNGNLILPTSGPVETDEFGNTVPAFSTEESTSAYPGINESTSQSGPWNPSTPGSTANPLNPTGPTSPTSFTRPTESGSSGGPGDMVPSSPGGVQPSVPNVTEPTTTASWPGGESSSAVSPGGVLGGTPAGTPTGSTPGGSTSGAPGEVIGNRGPGE